MAKPVDHDASDLAPSYQKHESPLTDVAPTTTHAAYGGKDAGQARQNGQLVRLRDASRCIHSCHGLVHAPVTIAAKQDARR